MTIGAWQQRRVELEAEITAQGYTRTHAKELAARLAPNPDQTRARKARATRNARKTQPGK